ncbi:MAG: glycosyl hydrolase family 17 [Saprospiraceae bacterium]|nr:glycosyl hydrolase family 17 [Saprospiraceae bacterium]
MRLLFSSLFIGLLSLILSSCNSKNAEVKSSSDINASDILGDPAYQAISYGGYRQTTRDIQPTMEELKDDMKLLAAMDVKLLRTYNVSLAQASNLLQAIRELKEADPEFEMYVMLGAWINCENAFSDKTPNHDKEDEAANTAEIARAVELTNEYADIVKIIAVGNEAMVKWAASYYVQPGVILKWVNHLQELKQNGELPADLWITSSDNFASWGGGGEEYHVEDLTALIKAVDFLSVHTYPMHDSHYNADFWGVLESEADLDKAGQIEAVMDRSLQYAQNQYQRVVDYMKAQGVDKPVHIGETGWASFSGGHYGNDGSKACDEYKEGLFYQKMRDWTNESNISCFYFEAFDEPWKGGDSPGDSEKHFGLFTVDGQAKYAIWDLVDARTFDGLSRDGQPITKSLDGDEKKVFDLSQIPETKSELILTNF